ncbi:MAG: hypothetical protein OXI67_00325 [Candidatus Poribacteria bacterium]|nr:hypothetical protein [Candidatus Poribacteria bacterium]
MLDELESDARVVALFCVETAPEACHRSTENGGCTLTFVGFQKTLETIPAGTLLRVSLAHWWRPESTPIGVNLRKYYVLSV